MWKVTVCTFAVILVSINCNPIQETETSTQKHKYYVFSSIDHESPLPEHAEEVPAHALPRELHEDNTDDMPKKKIVAIPMSKVSANTQILANDAGRAFVARMEEHSNEIRKDDDDMEAAETVVFRPLFAYRKKQAQRRRVYVPVGYQNYQNYQNYHDSQPCYYKNPHRRHYPVYYHKAEFPVLA